MGYFAGVVDLLGVWSTFQTSAGTDVPNVAINSPKEELITWLCEQTGVNVIYRRRQYNKHTCKEHCSQAHQHVWSMSYRWSLGGARATIVAYNLLEHSRTNHAVLVEAIKVGLEAKHHKALTVAKMKALGWEIPLDWEEDAA